MLACNSIKFISIYLKIGHPGLKGGEAQGHGLREDCNKPIVSCYTFSLQFYYIHEESKPTCCTVILLIFSWLSNMFRPDLLAIFRRHMQRFFHLELSHVVTTVVVFTVIKIINSSSQWPRVLRRRSAAARLLRLWVRILPGAMDVCLLWVLCVVR